MPSKRRACVRLVSIRACDGNVLAALGRSCKLFAAAGPARELPALARALPVGSTASSGIVDAVEAVLLVAEVARFSSTTPGWLDVFLPCVCKRKPTTHLAMQSATLAAAMCKCSEAKGQ